MRRATLAARVAFCLAASLCVSAIGGLPPVADAQPPALSATAGALIEAGTGRLLYGLNQDQQHAIASTTKLMTALLVLEHVKDLGTTFIQNDYYPAAADSQIGLVPGERMSVHDLLLAMLLPSADDAAEDLAYNVGNGSVGYFVGMMDVRARELHLTNTHYSTPIGLDDPGNYSSAADLVKLARYVLMHRPWFRWAVRQPAATLLSGNYVRHVVNRNGLVARYWWINGVKTGHTIDAGYVLVGSGTYRGMTLISAVLGTDSEASRDANTLALLNYGFSTFHLVKPITRGQVVARVAVKDEKVKAEIVAASGFSDVVAINPGVRVVLQLPRRLTGPKPRHARVGTAVILQGRRTLARIALVLARRLRRPPPAPALSAARLISRPITLILLAVVLGVVTIVAVVRRGPGRATAAAGSQAEA